MDLFELAGQQERKRQAPLADRIRPLDLDEFVGQEEIVGPGRLLRRSIESDQLRSAIFYGPPGTGKTTLAKVIANSTKGEFVQLNAVTSGVADIREVSREARDRLNHYGKKTVLFIDEIHRFNKSQQDALLPFVEDGTIILIGATTENPYFEVNAALLSRSRIFALKPLDDEDIRKLLLFALQEVERGLGQYKVELQPQALDHLIMVARGDARTALNALELAVLTTAPGPDGVRVVSLEVAEESIQRPAIIYDKSGDQHYDVISAFIKSLRGSDPDAAIHWFARMLYAGEDPRFIARRLVIHAAEDVGLADPQALQIAVAAAQALEFVGMPEARIPLAEAVIYIATAPKSNSAYKAIGGALSDMEHRKVGSVPMHLRDASYKGAAKLGHGKYYKYPHDYEGSYIKQQYLPDELSGTKYYHPGNNTNESKISQRQKERNNK
ncbi:MAG TPA: AAA family ATPase [Bacillota bacterium]|nr:AAA family ATPase [Bacillota bacterium]